MPFDVLFGHSPYQSAGGTKVNVPSGLNTVTLPMSGGCVIAKTVRLLPALGEVICDSSALFTRGLRLVSLAYIVYCVESSV